ncbi:MAG: type IV pilus twitching motility protein PilT [Planctomycetota bacterium]|jgi:twitching motility protein PilT
MAERYLPDVKVYPTENMGKLSILDMLKYFETQGAMRVSDLHIKVGAPPAYRIDGELVKLRGVSVTVDMAVDLIYPLLTEEKLTELQEKCSADSSYRLGGLQFRINVFKENDGICAAIRALSLDIPKVENIGFPNNIWEDIIDSKQGLVLVTGIKKHACRIITLEDPIEYIYQQRHAIISQREIGADVRSFVEGLRSMMREDPDIIFVGEMRDPETIAMTLMAAETGHLVFSTLHTRDATGTITRILDYFPPERQSEVRNQLSLGLKCIVSQKLIPRKDGNGRIVAMEILNNNYACANQIRTGKLEQLYSQLQTKTSDKPDEKMLTMERHLAYLVKTGEVELLEAQRWANNILSFTDAMKKREPVQE